MKIGEANLLLLLADAHPYCRLLACHLDALIRIAPHEAEKVRQLRIVSGMTQKELATLMGYKLPSWKSKESPLNAGTLNPGEYNFLMLLTGTHSELSLVEK
ncbi:helix-turn-helix transcriptional regulator [Serratia sp. M24T3]|uniref:helix-turn-helix domain-containing protein n=1 Tax=Serratia sp. M24T3 TaxID=932213 RepID=UPI0002DD31FE|nr:helix-turn-helix transcriptional regulator [Serratia sp. M24T3]